MVMTSSRQISRRYLDVAGTHLCCVEFGGEGTPVLLLHGLAGRGNEWWTTARWLVEAHHVIALDQRGHGRSDKALHDFSRDANVRDVIGVLEQLTARPSILIGQSLGGLNAFLVAARRPDLVQGLIVVEATPSRDPQAQARVRDWLASWPVPFPTLAHAQAFFGGETLSASTWLEVLEERADGYWPQFEPESMLRSLDDVATQDYWHEWEQIQCPTLVVGGANSSLPQAELADMARRIHHGRYVQIAQAGHNLHLDQPDAWRQAATAFLQELRSATHTP